MEQKDEKLINLILERLDQIDAEIAELKRAALARPTQPPEQSAPRIRPAEFRRPVKPPAPSGRESSIETAIGTRWLGRIGMVAMVFGIAFFLKYSFDNRLIGETGRIVLGLIAGIVFLGLGEHFQMRRAWPVYGQILTGGGMAILYFSLYAAFAFYHLIAQPLAFGALIAVTAAGIGLSLRYSARSVAVLGILGGFLTPILLSTGENRPVTLFSYILLLDIGLLLIVHLRKWQDVALLSLVGTVLIYAGWHDQFYSVQQQPLAFTVSAVFFLLYRSHLLSYRGLSPAWIDQAVIALSAAFLLIAFYLQNQELNDRLFKSFLLTLTAVEGAAAGLNRKIAPGRDATTVGFAASAMAVSVVAIFAILDRPWISAALAAEMVVLGFVGHRTNSIAVRSAAYLLGLLSVGRFFLEITASGFTSGTMLVLNTRFLVSAFIIAAFYVLLALSVRGRDSLLPAESIAAPVLLATTQVLSVILLSVEFYEYYQYAARQRNLPYAEFRYGSQLSLSIIWTIYAAGLVFIGIIRKGRLLRFLGICLIAITIVKVFFFDLSELETIYRIVSFVILGLLLLAVSYFYNRYRDRIFGDG